MEQTPKRDWVPRFYKNFIAYSNIKLPSWCNTKCIILFGWEITTSIPFLEVKSRQILGSVSLFVRVRMIGKVPVDCDNNVRKIKLYGIRKLNYVTNSLGPWCGKLPTCYKNSARAEPRDPRVVCFYTGFNIAIICPIHTSHCILKKSQSFCKKQNLQCM